MKSVSKLGSRTLVALAVSATLVLGAGLATPAWSADKDSKPKVSISRPFAKPVDQAQKLFKEQKWDEAICCSERSGGTGAASRRTTSSYSTS